MTVARDVPAHDFPPPPEPDLTPEAVIARAGAIAASLVDRQAETERRTYYSEDTHREFLDAGFYRLIVPRRFGGYEFGVQTLVRVATALARGCPSTGWMYLFGAAHALVAASLFEEKAQSELFAEGDFVCPAAVAPTGTAARTSDGDWLINGTWGYCSGSPYATHFIGHALAVGPDGQPAEPVMFVLPRQQWRRLDDWGGQLGLRGSGSHGIAVTDARVPDHHVLPVHLSQLSVTGGTPGRLLHGNPEYGGGPLSFMLLELGALAVGMAQGALDAYEELLRTRSTIFPPVVLRMEDPDYQFRYGEAVGLLATAEAALTDAVRQWSEACASGPQVFTRETELRLATISREVVRLCWRAVEGHLFPSAGSSASRQGERMERVWRDMSMLHGHAGLSTFLAMKANRELAQAHFGLA
ncbi:acyl-CoA dehydrogenase family protein [Micromonospora sp. NPDC051543]|uniref:acyl-CoA dehydrogenase family protein n=1 Tax=Micromonospora sp. NPDC051543 TaxID=3364287 RepID=UPI0037B1217F